MSRRQTWLWTYEPPPVLRVDSITPDHGPEAGGTAVTILGQGFTGAGEVRISRFRIGYPNSNVDDLVIVDDETITCTTPAKPMFGGSPAHVYVARSDDDVGELDDAFTYEALSVPVLTSSDYTQGVTSGGGQAIVLAGTGFTGVTGSSGVTFLGTDATSYVVDSDIQITAVLPAHAAGSGSIVVTHPVNGASNNLSFEYWDPTVPATPTQWVKANYTGSPWVASHGVNLTEGTNAPSTGSTVGTGSFTPADFDGTNDKLAGSAVPYANLNGSISFATLIYIDAMAAQAANPYQDVCYFADSDGAFGLSQGVVAATDSLRAFAYTGAVYNTVDITTNAFHTGAWILVFMRYDGSANTFEGGTNGDTLASGSANGGYSYAAQTMSVGSAYNQASPFLNGKILEHIFWGATINDANRTKLRKYCNQLYGVSV